MKWSILENPKNSKKASLQLGTHERFFTPYCRKRITNFYHSIIPAHIEKDKQIWLDTPEKITKFIKELESTNTDLSMIEYVCIIDNITDIYDIIDFYSRLKNKLPDHAKILYSNFNWIWSPIFRIASFLGLSRHRPLSNFYRDGDLDCFMDMSGWENVKKIKRYILPCKIPIIGAIFDNFLVRLPLFRIFSLNTIFIARKSSDGQHKDHTVTVLVPCKNEEKNIFAIINRMPSFGQSLEILFINDKSTDDTEKNILQYQKEYPHKNIVLTQGQGLGKGEAIRTGMKTATGDICIILDADLTVIPEDLPQFYESLNSRRADFIHGTRLIYSQEDNAMRFANILGNIGFSIIFTYILEHRTTDTLCGTKVYWRKDWAIFEEMKLILKNSDLWGDYNLIFGASRYGLKIAQLPVRYFERLEGVTKMNNRIKNGFIMLRVAWHALWKVKFIN